jgi:hypothetical protein
MSGQPAGRLATIPAWVRSGVIAGVVAFACTLSANIAITWFKPADLCRAGPLIIPLFMLAALVAFLLLAAAAGFATGRASGPGSSAALAGLLVGVLGGCALLGLIPFAPSISQRIQDLMALCPGAGGSFSFDLGPTPPPGVILATPPPGFFTTSPPPGAMAGPPTGVAALFSAVISITLGIGLAAGAAALGGLLGVATRSDAGADRPS